MYEDIMGHSLMFFGIGLPLAVLWVSKDIMQVLKQTEPHRHRSGVSREVWQQALGMVPQRWVQTHPLLWNSGGKKA